MNSLIGDLLVSLCLLSEIRIVPNYIWIGAMVLYFCKLNDAVNVVIKKSRKSFIYIVPCPNDFYRMVNNANKFHLLSSYRSMVARFIFFNLWINNVLPSVFDLDTVPLTTDPAYIEKHINWNACLVINLFTTYKLIYVNE